MAFQGFGKNSGPSFPPRSPTHFGSFATAAAAPVTTTSNPPVGNDPTPMHSTTLQQKQEQEQHYHHERDGILQSRRNVQTSTLVSEGNHLDAPIVEARSLRSSDYHAPKRTRSPPIQISNDVSTSQFAFHDLDAEREMHAKAKRLARFGAELSQSVQKLPDSKWHKSSDTEHNQSLIENMKVAENDSKKFTGEFQDRRILPDSEYQDPSTAIVGLCQDMCPGSEREERERKGDLDQYERLDGERNQTSESLAVKKYNRMAEREAVLIRPMPILQKTIDYLLEIINQPYNYKFLGMYNFLWDRLRAIRMDLRMQHIFNQNAIIMLEQMIRLHIIAMHELCEYNKGEGFSEGFDAHLNIEQMNKTSVELFQMYDDHRKKGINILTEKEFRGYYALLKLDKHPGYKVEPAELSLDLARMTPKIRGSQEVLFARDVARACRMGNFIAFFRLAKEATYLQACLMHAHFAKLRTHALASLHSGLQNNQGIPVAHVVKWLGMEGEDIDDLIQYHGFSIKIFEDVYMVKEKPFLNSDVDYPTTCSKLVQSKKSLRIVDDVASGPVALDFSSRKTISSDVKDKLSCRASEITAVSDRNDFADAVSEVPARSDLLEQFSHRITNNPEVSSLEAKFIHKTTTSSEGWTDTTTEELQNDSLMKSMELTETSTSIPSCQSEKTNFEVNNINGLFPVDGTSVMTRVDDQLSYSNEYMRDEFVLTSTSPKRKPIQIQAPGKSFTDFAVKSQKMQKETYHLKEAEVLQRKSQQREAVMRKLKIILRKWKANASRKREIREQRLLLASLALSSISLGPSLRQNENHEGHAEEKFDISYIMRERNNKCGKSLSRVNVAGVVGPVLVTKNHTSRCLCWKLLFCHNRSDMVQKADKRASTWLVSKLLGSGTRDEDELVHLSTGLSIWKKLIDEIPDGTKSICFSVIREVLFDNDREEHSDLMVGANAIVYLASESTPYEIQQNHLHSLLLSIPSGSRLPLLILSYNVQMGEMSSPQSVISRLGLLDADNTRVSCVSVVFLSGDGPEEHHCGGFLSDSSLRKGLQWLADQSPLQPTLHLVKTRDLVLKYLGSSLKLIDNMKISCLDPEDCIAIFNEALQKSANQVQSAAYMNPNGWPCPEINLIKGSSIEKGVIETLLPKTRWSSEVRIKPIVAAICGCKLPSFPDSLSWLSQGSYMGKEILDQKLSLEKYLCNYLMEAAEIMSGDLALKEAHLMVQRGAVLELRGSYYHIVPRWLIIFQRIYNWCLMRLVGSEIAFAYVLNHDEPFTIGIDPNALMSFQGYNSRGDNEPNFQYGMQLNLAPLDEMVEVACCFPSNELPASNEPPERDAEMPEIVSRPSENDKDTDLDYPLKAWDDIFSDEHEKELSPVAPLGGYDRLSSLLEKCNMLQNSIAKNLSIYF